MATNTLQISAARRAEMEQLFQSHEGTLTPRQVLEYASDPTTALHSAFTWDDSEAADRYRVNEARSLIRRTFVVLPIPGSNEERRVHMALSLPQDRGTVGYRLMSHALGDPELRDQMIRSAMRELAAFRKKYADLQELAQVFSAIDETVSPAA